MALFGNVRQKILNNLDKGMPNRIFYVMEGTDNAKKNN